MFYWGGYGCCIEALVVMGRVVDWRRRVVCVGVWCDMRFVGWWLEEGSQVVCECFVEVSRVRGWSLKGGLGAGSSVGRNERSRLTMRSW